jgi:hypothetical protein
VRTAQVGSASIEAEPGRPLTARYWTNRRTGEDYKTWQERHALLCGLKHARKQMADALANITTEIERLEKL